MITTIRTTCVLDLSFTLIRSLEEMLVKDMPFDVKKRFWKGIFRTVKDKIEFEGIGMHTGEEARVIIHPDESGEIRFLKNGVYIKADVDNVVDVFRGTSLHSEGERIDTVEHLMAVLFAAGINSAVIEFVRGEEFPIFDGSARVMAEAIDNVGIEEFIAEKVEGEGYFLTPLSVEDESKRVKATYVPSPGFEVSFLLDYRGTPIGIQTFKFNLTWQNFKRDIAPARTFGFEKELGFLKKKGLIKGASLDNAILVKEDGIVVKDSLRWENEFVRHKILDFLGDISLAGVKLDGKWLLERSGHKYNVALAKKVKWLAKRCVRRMNFEEIKELLPHRYPFLLVDRVLDFEEGKKIVTLKNVTGNEAFFTGHFPHRAVMPGVLIVEALAQSAGVLVLKSFNLKNITPFFAAIDKVRFKKPVKPGDTLIMEVELLMKKARICKVKGTAYVNAEVVTEGEFTFSLLADEFKKLQVCN